MRSLSHRPLAPTPQTGASSNRLLPSGLHCSSRIESLVSGQPENTHFHHLQSCLGNSLRVWSHACGGQDRISGRSPYLGSNPGASLPSPLRDSRWRPQLRRIAMARGPLELPVSRSRPEHCLPCQVPRLPRCCTPPRQTRFSRQYGTIGKIGLVRGTPFNCPQKEMGGLRQKAVCLSGNRPRLFGPLHSPHCYFQLQDPRRWARVRHFFLQGSQGFQPAEDDDARCLRIHPALPAPRAAIRSNAHPAFRLPRQPLEGCSIGALPRNSQGDATGVAGTLRWIPVLVGRPETLPSVWSGTAHPHPNSCPKTMGFLVMNSNTKLSALDRSGLFRTSHSCVQIRRIANIVSLPRHIRAPLSLPHPRRGLLRNPKIQSSASGHLYKTHSPR